MEEKLLIDSIIFDVDGTLWDSTDVVADAWNQIMEKETDMTPNLTGAVLKGLFGRLLPDIAAVIFHEYPKERSRHAVPKSMRHFLRHRLLFIRGLSMHFLFFPDITRFIS